MIGIIIQAGNGGKNLPFRDRDVGELLVPFGRGKCMFRWLLQTDDQRGDLRARGKKTGYHRNLPAEGERAKERALFAMNDSSKTSAG